MDAKARLPPELYRQIVRDESIGRKEILNLCLTSRDFSVEAYPVLYRHMDFSDSDVRTSELAFRTLCTSKKILTMIYELTIRLNLDKERWFEDKRQEFIDLVNGMTNLHRLHIDAPKTYILTNSWWGANLVLPNVHAIHLTRLYGSNTRVHDLFGRLPIPLPYLFCDFPLRGDHTHEIVHLQCEMVHFSLDIALPYLKSLVLTAPIGAMHCKRLSDNAPNLHTLVFLGYWPLRESWSAWVETLAIRSLKKIGPITVNRFDMEVVNGLSQFELEDVLYAVPEKFRQAFKSTAVEHMMHISPKCRRISVIFFAIKKPMQGSTQGRDRITRNDAKIWERKPSTGFMASVQLVEEVHHRQCPMEGMDFQEAVRRLLDLPF